MSANHDQNFIKSSIAVLGGLVVLTAIIMVAAILLTGSEKTQRQTAELKKVETRIQPVGTVITDASELQKLTAVAPHTPLAGPQVVAQVCSACHGAGVLGAPKIGDKVAWSTRKSADGGLDGLAASAEKGKGNMPARGGRADLSDDEIKGAITEMLKQTGV